MGEAGSQHGKRGKQYTSVYNATVKKRARVEISSNYRSPREGRSARKPAPCHFFVWILILLFLGTGIWSLDSLEKEMATTSSILTWRIPWTEEPSGYSSQGHKKLDMTEWTTHIHTACGLQRREQRLPLVPFEKEREGNYVYEHTHLTGVLDHPPRLYKLLVWPKTTQLNTNPISQRAKLAPGASRWRTGVGGREWGRGQRSA